MRSDAHSRPGCYDEASPSLSRCLWVLSQPGWSGQYRLVVRSAWIKWARAVEHQKMLARAMREFSSVNSYEYVRTDNAQYGDDPVISMHWRAVVKVSHPERWSVLLGDVFNNLRAALDHAFWAAVHAHSGPPPRPERIEFPIRPSEAKGKDKAKELAALVAPDVWRVVDAVQLDPNRS